jgi:hypothetical protein
MGCADDIDTSTASQLVLQSINKNLSLGATLRYINNDSNQNIYEYDKYVVRTNIYYSF